MIVECGVLKAKFRDLRKRKDRNCNNRNVENEML